MNASELAITLLQGIGNIDELQDGESVIFIAGFHRNGEILCNSLSGGTFTGVKPAKEKLAEVIEQIFSDVPTVGRDDHDARNN